MGYIYIVVPDTTNRYINININAYITTGYITNSNQDYDNQLERGYHRTSETYILLYNML